MFFFSIKVHVINYDFQLSKIKFLEPVQKKKLIEVKVSFYWSVVVLVILGTAHPSRSHKCSVGLRLEPSHPPHSQILEVVFGKSCSVGESVVVLEDSFVPDCGDTGLTLVAGFQLCTKIAD